MGLYDSIFVIGSYGMLAKALTEALRSRGHEPAGADRDTYDLTRRDDVARLFSEHRPTLLFNCAAYTAVDKCEEERDLADAINGHAVGTLAEFARHHGTCLVHYSTDFVFDGSSRRPYHPDDEPRPLSAYGRSKLLGERKLIENAPEKWLILRTAWLYGRGGASFPKTIVERARAGQPLKVVNDQFGSPTYTPDLAEATLDLVHHRAHGIYHVTNGGTATWFEFAQAIHKEFDVPGTVTPITSADWQQIRPSSAVRPAYSVLDLEPFERLVGRPMRPWQEALHSFHQSVKASGSF